MDFPLSRLIWSEKSEIQNDSDNLNQIMALYPYDNPRKGFAVLFVY